MAVLDIIHELKEKDVDVNQYKWYNHMRNHLKPEVAQLMSANSPMLANEAIDRLGVLIQMTSTLSEKIEGFNNSINPDADPAQIRAYTGLISECRHMVESIAKMQGEFKGSGAIHAQTVNIQYNSVVEQIMQDVCQSCKVKLSKTLEPLILRKSEE